MARKVRLEYRGAFYHVINRGNYRSWIFETDGAKKSFLKCLKEAADAMNWRLHAWVLMSNHYHLCLETPDANLVEGMSWVGSTFSNRFNRLRRENGHVFQGRYKAIVLDGPAVGPVCHYIHLNPVRGGLVEAAALQTYWSSSFHQVWYPSRRWNALSAFTCLRESGPFSDSPGGRSAYRNFLNELSCDEKAQQRLGFDHLSHGWAKGDKAFRQGLLKELTDGELSSGVESDTHELREELWERDLKRALSCLGKKDSDLRVDAKSAVWKVSLARYLRERKLSSNAWLARRLSMGTANSVSSLISRHRKNDSEDKWWVLLANQEIVD